MVDGKLASKKQRRAAQEVEMAQTADNYGRGGTHNDDAGEAYAQPKGVQTRAAIANHLAQKLKIGNQRMALADLIQADHDL